MSDLDISTSKAAQAHRQWRLDEWRKAVAETDEAIRRYGDGSPEVEAAAWREFFAGLYVKPSRVRNRPDPGSEYDDAA